VTTPRACIIYGLIDPETYKVCYVGLSITGLARARRHLYPYYTGKLPKSPKHLRARGLKPIIVQLDERSDPEALNDLEMQWIAHMRAVGHPLLNLTSGGEGLGRGFRHTEESKAKMRAAQLARPPPSAETRAKMRAASLGRKISIETRLKLSQIRQGKPKGAKWKAAVLSALRVPVTDGTTLYASCRDAATKTGIDLGTLCLSVREGREIRGGAHKGKHFVQVSCNPPPVLQPQKDLPAP